MRYYRPTMNENETGNSMNKATEQKLEKIAREQLGLDTLETRNSDGLDFSDQAVWQLRKALEAAYRAGAQSGRAEYLKTRTKRSLRIYARQNGVTILQAWNKPELVRAILEAGK